jgi:hypothetical protein
LAQVIPGWADAAEVDPADDDPLLLELPLLHAATVNAMAMATTARVLALVCLLAFPLLRSGILSELIIFPLLFS